MITLFRKQCRRNFYSALQTPEHEINQYFLTRIKRTMQKWLLIFRTAQSLSLARRCMMALKIVSFVGSNSQEPRLMVLSESEERRLQRCGPVQGPSNPTTAYCTALLAQPCHAGPERAVHKMWHRIRSISWISNTSACPYEKSAVRDHFVFQK